jgi:hypothetical protein
MPKREYDSKFQDAHQVALDEFGDREVILGGEVLLFKVNVPYGIFIELDEMKNASPISTFGRAEEIIFSLVDGDEDALARARQNMRDTLTAADLLELLNMLIEDNSGRPTQAPSSSANGRTETGTESTDSSSSTPAEDSPA